MEQLLHYVWRHRIFPLAPLQTTAGVPVEVIDPGLPNTHAGPDFFNAKLRLGDTMWVGNVEVHLRASDWMRHGHQNDPAYDNVVLHVVAVADSAILRRTDGEPLPQLVLSCPDEVRQRYNELRETEMRPPCYTLIPDLPKLTVHSWLSALQVERFEQKAAAIRHRLEQCGGYWEDVFFVTLSRNFGFGINGDAFEAWAMRLPFRAVDKHRDDLLQVEALFFGMAGLLEEVVDDDYYLRLQREFHYLRHKFSLGDPLPVAQWRFLRLRPDNFPHVRLAQLANLYHREQSLFSRVMEAETLEAVQKLLMTTTSEYWEEHYNFRGTSPRRVKRLGKKALQLITINTVVSFLYAYGMHKSDERLCLRAARFLEELSSEDNYITRLWDGAGIPVNNAADSQALIQLQKEYCDKKDCLRCRFGYEYLRRKK